MATSDAPLNVPNVTLAVAIRSVLLPDAGNYSSVLEALYLDLHPDYKTWGAGPRSGVTTWYYVSATATGGGDGSTGSPWTLAEGISAALQPGQGLRLKAGTYNQSGDIRPTWSGTSGSPIYIEADDINNKPIIDFSSGMLDFRQNSYVGVYGLELTGRGIGGSFETASVDHLTCENCHIHGITGLQANNICAIRADRVSKSVFRNNLIEDISTDDGTGTIDPRGGSAYLSYAGFNNLFEHNEILSVGKGFYLKKPSEVSNNGSIVRRNKFINLQEAPIELGANSGVGSLAKMENDVFSENLCDSDAGVYVIANELQTQGQGLYIVNNTIRNAGAGINGYGGIRMWNNIFDKETFAGEAGLVFLYRAGSASNTTEFVKFDYNCYPRGIRAYDEAVNTTYTDLTSWRSATNTGSPLNLSPAGPDTNGLAVDPLYSDAANGDFTLATGSPCIGAGEGGDNMGAYATQTSVIGRVA